MAMATACFIDRVIALLCPQAATRARPVVGCLDRRVYAVGVIFQGTDSSPPIRQAVIRMRTASGLFRRLAHRPESGFFEADHGCPSVPKRLDAADGAMRGNPLRRRFPWSEVTFRLVRAAVASCLRRLGRRLPARLKRYGLSRTLPNVSRFSIRR